MAAEVVADLVAAGLASDRRFAEDYARVRVERGYGPVRVARDLRERGVGEDLIRETLAGYAGQWRERMEAVRSKRFGGAPAGRRARLRQARFLEYRGFPQDLIGAWLDGATGG